MTGACDVGGCDEESIGVFESAAPVGASRFMACETHAPDAPPVAPVSGA